ncbi:MAG: YbjN domain-containing protein [Rhodobacterales bacterium]|nr:MAG: YbjN domain-containing protein [Rhodobacterales bacterium]
MKTKSKLLTNLVLAAGLVLPQAALAEDLVDATQVDVIASLAAKYGTAEVDVDNTGDPMISGEIDDTHYMVLFYGCENGNNCTTIQYYTGWINPGGIDVDTLNDWNRDRRFSKAYIDAEGDPVIEFDVNLFGGVTETNLYDTFDWWRLVMSEFDEYISVNAADEPSLPPAPPAEREAESDDAPTGTPSSAIGMAQPDGDKVRAKK